MVLQKMPWLHLKAGAFDYLAKPVSLKQLRDLVKSALSLPPIQTDRHRKSNRISVSCWANPNPCVSYVATIDKLSVARLLVYISVNRVAARSWRHE